MAEITLETVFIPSQDVVSREIEGEVIIVPLTSGIGETDDELFTLNETGKAIWLELDGEKSLQDVVNTLASEYDAPADALQSDVLGLVDELFRRGMLAPAA